MTTASKEPTSEVQVPKTYSITLSNIASEAQHEIAKECVNIGRFLIQQNQRYGDSILEPTDGFCNLSPITRIDVQLDYILPRFYRSKEDKALLNLIGWLILRRIAAAHHRSFYAQTPKHTEE